MKKNKHLILAMSLLAGVSLSANAEATEGSDFKVVQVVTTDGRICCYDRSKVKEITFNTNDSGTKQAKIISTSGGTLKTYTRSEISSIDFVTHHNYVAQKVVNGYTFVNMCIHPSKDKNAFFATVNLGATSDKEAGNYYSWGETAPKDATYTYHWDTYVPNGSNTSYNATSCKTWDAEHLTEDGVLKEDVDAAAVAVKGARIPTVDEWMMLKNNCTWKDVSENPGSDARTWADITSGDIVNGYQVTSTYCTGQTFYICAAGYHNLNTSNLTNRGGIGDYWTSQINYNSEDYAYNMGISKSWHTVGSGGYYRAGGMPIRAVLIVDQK